jgi:hypothetical protein
MGKSKIEQTNCSCFKKEGLLRVAVFLGNLNDPYEFSNSSSWTIPAGFYHSAICATTINSLLAFVALFIYRTQRLERRTEGGADARHTGDVHASVGAGTRKIGKQALLLTSHSWMVSS